MDRAEISRLIEHLDSLPTLSAVATRILQLTSDQLSDMNSIARIIESDQAMTTRLLRLVNSAAYSLTQEITTVPRAVAVLGFNAIRCLALGMAVADLFPHDSQQDVFSPKEFWKHSLACAVCAELLAVQSTKRIDKNEAFVAGLLHDIGKLVLSQCVRDEYGVVMTRVRETNGSLLEVEQDLLGVTHTEAGKWIADRWGLPDVFGQVIWMHHQHPGAMTETGFNAPMIFVVQLADTLVRSQMIGSGGNDRAEAISDALLHEVGVNQRVVADVKGSLCKRVEERSAIVDLDLDEVSLYLESLQKANAELSRLNLRYEEQNRELSRREKRLRALNDVNGHLTPGQTISDVLALLSMTLRDGFEIRSGLCYTADGQQNRVDGKAWSHAGPLRDLTISLRSGDNGGAEALRKFDPVVAAVLTENALCFEGNSWLGQDMKSVLKRHHLVVVPMIAGGRSHGQIVLDYREPGERARSENDLSEVLTFASAAGLAVSRVRINETLKRRSEELATAIWKQEQAHKQLLHVERLAAVGKMAAGAAHEINNPLAVISGRAQIMLQKEQDPAKVTAFKVMIDQCARASKILTDLMGFARPALPKMEALSVNSVVDETLALFEDRFHSSGIALNRTLAPKLPDVLLDKRQMQQVFVNLLINAEHATNRGGSVLVTTGMNRANDRVFITFADTGCGISRENLDHIFEPFFSTKEEGKGTGLGLSLAYGIVTSHQGAISADSTLGKGTTFTISLPVATDVESLAPKQPTAMWATNERRVQKPAAARILVVDDEHQVRSLIADTLDDRGYIVEQAENGLLALELLQRTHIDLMTLDVRMPRMDGMAVLRAVRERLPKLPIIIVTGLASDEEMAAAMKLGVVTVVRKPFEIEQLMQEIQRALAARTL